MYASSFASTSNFVTALVSDSKNIKTKNSVFFLRRSCTFYEDFDKCKCLKGIIKPFKLKEIDFFYYLIDAGEFSYSNDIH